MEKVIQRIINERIESNLHGDVDIFEAQQKNHQSLLFIMRFKFFCQVKSNYTIFGAKKIWPTDFFRIC